MQALRISNATRGPREQKRTDASLTTALLALLAAFAAFLLLVLFAPAANAERLVIEPGSAWSDGGYVRQYVRKRNKVDAVEIRGRCVSSCTVFLSHENVCVSRKARFGFHALSYRGAIASTAVQQDYAFNLLGCPDLGQWFLAGPAHERKRVVYLNGSAVIDACGFRECEA